jgi:hypothetical protein
MTVLKELAGWVADKALTTKDPADLAAFVEVEVGNVLNAEIERVSIVHRGELNESRAAKAAVEAERDDLRAKAAKPE